MREKTMKIEEVGAMRRLLRWWSRGGGNGVAVLGVCGLMAAALLKTAGCEWEDPELAENHAPVINHVLVDGVVVATPRVYEGQKVVLKAVVWDPNGDEMRSEGFNWESSGGELENTQGSSVVWQAPDVTWEVPPQQVLVDVQVTVADGRGGEDVKGITLEVEPPCDPNNAAPVVVDMTATPESISLGDSSTITVQAEDADGDTLSYEWIVPFGRYEGKGAQVSWVTTETCCRDWYPVQVFVSDGCDTAWAKVDVEVIP